MLIVIPNAQDKLQTYPVKKKLFIETKVLFKPLVSFRAIREKSRIKTKRLIRNSMKKDQKETHDLSKTFVLKDKFL